MSNDKIMLLRISLQLDGEDKPLDLVNEDDRLRVVETVTNSLIEDGDLSPIAYVSTVHKAEPLTPGKELFIYTLNDNTDLKKLAALCDFTSIIDSIHHYFRHGYRVIIMPAGVDSYMLFRVYGKHRDSYILGGVTVKRSSEVIKVTDVPKGTPIITTPKGEA